MRRGVLLVAGYNAGPGAAQGWVSPLLQASPELWVEAIPYPETRLYVKKVLGCCLWPAVYCRDPGWRQSLLSINLTKANSCCL